MTTDDFRAALAADGFQEAVLREVEPDCAVALHEHPWEVRALVVEGCMSLIVDGVVTSYPKGQVFTLPHAYPHEEFAGPEGATLLAGRKHPAGWMPAAA